MGVPKKMPWTFFTFTVGDKMIFYHAYYGKWASNLRNLPIQNTVFLSITSDVNIWFTHLSYDKICVRHWQLQNCILKTVKWCPLIGLWIITNDRGNKTPLVPRSIFSTHIANTHMTTKDRASLRLVSWFGGRFHFKDILSSLVWAAGIT